MLYLKVDLNITLARAKPFLKWAGGKGQLLSTIEQALPGGLKKGKFTYIEPFAGSGAVLFWVLKKYPNIAHAVINDINADLCKAYITVKNSPGPLISVLGNLQDLYYAINIEEERRSFFLAKRKEFNSRSLQDIEHTALLIFLNRTCFNGMYRVNSNSNFNVPFGRYNKPKICDAGTIYADSAILQKVTILNGDYSQTLGHVTENTFFYLDPPYKPISKTASFNSYSNEAFNDNEQIRLKGFCDTLTENNCLWLLSNSDPKNINPDDNFFDELYKGSSVYMDRVKAKRSINSNSAKRGDIAELLISNYKKIFA